MGVTSPRGFVAAGAACGVKPGGDPDLALVATASGRPVPAAGVFTSNKATAAPVLVSRSHLGATGGLAVGVILNSGNANAATGATGQQHAARMCAAVAAPLGVDVEHVLVCSTGLIGIPLPVERIESAAPALVTALAADGGGRAARAIMTTDTRQKETVVAGDGFTVGGMAKGAAMLAPNMATMLAVLTTDAEVDSAGLEAALSAGVAGSFNALSTDGCTSTNDTVLLLASGLAGPVDAAAFHRAVAAACDDLAGQMAADAEGATKVVRVEVEGAASSADAERIARRIADSALCKCSWYGQDPYWGRILSEAGSAGADFDMDRASVSYGGIEVARGGVAHDHDEAAVLAHMQGPQLLVTVSLGLGTSTGRIVTNDLTHAYVDENMGTS